MGYTRGRTKAPLPGPSGVGRPGRRLKIALSLGIVVALMGFGNWIVGAIRVGEYKQAVEGLARLQSPPGLGSSQRQDVTKEEDRHSEAIEERYRFYLTVVTWGRWLVFSGMLTVLISLLAALRVWGGPGRQKGQFAR